MGIKFQILSVALLLGVVGLSLQTSLRGPDGRLIRPEESSPSPAQVGPIRPNWFVDLGYLDGRYYYMETELKMNWTLAREHCNMHFMRMSTIDTKEQFDFVVEKVKPYGQQMLWTSARESREPSMFVWDGTQGRRPNSSVIAQWGHQREWEPFHHCGAFWVSDNFSQFWTDNCDQEYYVLCQI